MALNIDDLNEAQAEVVKTTHGPLLVLAGAGSGKTRALTYRIAHLIHDVGVSPYQILAITFTNKAAAEMRSRLFDLVGPMRGMWVLTFHSLCARMLRIDADRVGFTSSFTIYDDDDQKRLMREIYAQLDINPKMFPIQAVRGKISDAKNELITAEEYVDMMHVNPVEKAAAKVYPIYSERLKRANAMDFDDLLLYAYLLLKDNPDVLEGYQERFTFISVDEYQDTNHAQYEITKLLASKYRNLMVVGDDDQSIYSWRGADIQNILSFESDYPDAKVVKLEQNYRSTDTILKAANEVISNNENRKPKRLFTKGDEGDKIDIYLASDERDEGRWIASEIEKGVLLGAKYSDYAVFYRTNAQSRSLEDMFLRAGIPYEIVGGTRFFERAEIRDVMAYLSLVVNPADDISAKRIINTPRRSIGKATVQAIEVRAAEDGLTFMEALRASLVLDDFPARTKNALAAFDAMIEEVRAYTGSMRDVVEMIVEKTGLMQYLEEQKTPEAQSRVENIKEFFGVVSEYEETHEDEGESWEPEPGDEAAEVPEAEPEDDGLGTAQRMLVPLMEWLSLRTDLDSLDDSDSFVTLMTVHSAKGLEFPYVFLAGMEDGIFPHMNSMFEKSGLEEERRLAYVAITRAKKRLSIICCQHRSLYGNTTSYPKSRFVQEIPDECVSVAGIGSSGYSGTGREKRGSRKGIYGSGTRYERGEPQRTHRTAATADNLLGSSSSRRERGSDFSVGDKVDHKVFGRGVVVKVEGDALSVEFERTGETKRLLAGLAPIVKIQ
ncbi:MAG: UvrD-helicase domain-containing protein [bacterium]|nr:UvrD-helicase domain-containing protein [bacterium]